MHNAVNAAFALRQPERLLQIPATLSSGHSGHRKGVSGLTLPGMEPTTSQSRGAHSTAGPVAATCSQKHGSREGKIRRL